MRANFNKPCQHCIDAHKKTLRSGNAVDLWARSSILQGASAECFGRTKSVALRIARALASASSPVSLPSRRPSVSAAEPLEVAKASRPTPVRILTEPTSQGGLESKTSPCVSVVAETEMLFCLGNGHRLFWFSVQANCGCQIPQDSILSAARAAQDEFS